MKKFFCITSLLAIVALASFSCQTNTDEVVSPVLNNISLTINAVAPATKTIITPGTGENAGTYTPSWSANDKLGVYVDDATEMVELVNESAGSTASFAGTVSLLEGDRTFRSIYPKEAIATRVSSSSSEVRVNLAKIQYPAMASFDGAADILVGKTVVKTVAGSIGESIIINDMQFARPMAVVKIVLIDGTTGDVVSSDVVSSVTMTAADYILTGRAQIETATAAINDWTIDYDNVVASYEGSDFVINGANAAYVIVNPITVASAKTLKFDIETDNHDISKTVTLASDVAFAAGKVNVINLTIEDANCSEKVVDTSVFNISFGTGVNGDATKITYSTDYDMGTTGTSASSLEYGFSSSSNQIRGNTNQFTSGNYDGASSNGFWWAAAADSFTISKVAIGENLNFALSFGAKYAASTVQAYVSKDGINFYQLSDAGVAVTTTASLKTMNFTLPNDTYSNLSFKLVNEGGSSIVIDDVKLMPLASAAEGSYSVSFSAPHNLAVSVSELKLAATASATATFTVTSNYDWTASTTDTGFDFTPKSGTASASPVTVTVTASAAGGSVEATLGAITVTDGTASYNKTVSVKQLAAGSVAEPVTITLNTFFSISGSMDGIISYSAEKGGGTSNPVINSSAIRLYQNAAGTGGGFITVTAASGYKIQSVTIGSSMATSVKYSINGGADTPSEAAIIITANGTAAITGQSATSVKITCYGTSTSSRLYVNYLSVAYIAN